MGEDKSEVNKEDDKGHNDNEKDDDEGDDEDDDETTTTRHKKDNEEDKRWSSFYLRRSTCSMDGGDSRIVSPFVSGGFSKLLEHTRSAWKHVGGFAALGM